MSAAWRVLIADDDLEICTLIRAMLKRGPYTVTAVNDAESALAQLQNGGLTSDGPFDLVICDYMLPGMSGIELIEQIRANPVWANVAIVLISGDDPSVMDARARDSGANAFLTKPFSLALLRTTVQTLLDRRLTVASRL